LDNAVTDAVLRVEFRILVPFDELDLLLNTVSVLDPRLSIDFSIDCELPVPMANSTITDATPIRTPSIVSSVRSQFDPIPRMAMTRFPNAAAISFRLLWCQRSIWPMARVHTTPRA
jgi:hypothetical protein